MQEQAHRRRHPPGAADELRQHLDFCQRGSPPLAEQGFEVPPELVPTAGPPDRIRTARPSSARRPARYPARSAPRYPTPRCSWSRRPRFNRFRLPIAASRKASATFGQYPWSARTNPRFSALLPLLLTERASSELDRFEAIRYFLQGIGGS